MFFSSTIAAGWQMYWFTRNGVTPVAWLTLEIANLAARTFTPTIWIKYTSHTAPVITLPADTWHILRLHYEGETLSLYLDNVLVDSFTASSDYTPADVRLFQLSIVHELEIAAPTVRIRDLTITTE